MRSGRGLGLALLIGIILLVSIGCAPRFNWREVRPEGQGYLVLMPDRPASLSRAIELDGLTLTMDMTGARVDTSLFTVGRVVLATGDPERPARVLAQMRSGMLRNIGASASVERATSVMVVDASGRSLGREPALRIEAKGLVGGQAIRMLALFVARGEQLWQVVAMGPENRVAESETLLDSFRLME